MTTPIATPESQAFTSAIAKASMRILPMLVILYVVSFLDHTNVGIGASGLEVDRGISDAATGRRLSGGEAAIARDVGYVSAVNPASVG